MLMKISMCNISFMIDYTSSTPITSATASYNISGSGNPPVVYNITPLPSSGSTITLPDIQTPGNYDLSVTLTTADGGSATKTSSFKIGNCSENTLPTVNLKWQDNLGTEDRFCNTLTCDSYTILIESLDPNNDIVSNEVFMSRDNGITWSSIFANLPGGNTFSSGAIEVGTSSFKVVTTDSLGNKATSNILSYTKEQISSKIYITDYNPPVSEDGTNISYKLHVEDADFNGYILTKLDINGGDIHSAGASFTPLGLSVSFTPTHFNDMEKAMPVTIPIGVYDCLINLYIDWNDAGQAFVAESYIIYSTTDQYEDEITSARAWREFYFDAP